LIFSPVFPRIPAFIAMKTVLLLAVSNIFMTFASYGPLKFKNSPPLELSCRIFHDPWNGFFHLQKMVN